jgi:hypothetical protein
MSVAVATAAPQPSPSFVSGAAATRIAGVSATRLQRLALLGLVRVELLPGMTPKYSRVDVERLRTASAS